MVFFKVSLSSKNESCPALLFMVIELTFTPHEIKAWVNFFASDGGKSQSSEKEIRQNFPFLFLEKSRKAEPNFPPKSLSKSK